MSEKVPAQGPLRSTTTESTTSETAIPPETGDVAGLLIERLRAWKHAIAYIEAYIIQTEALHKSTSKEYQKVLKTVDEPLREGYQFNQSVGGVASFFENIRANTARLATSHNETAASLKSNVLPGLERLHKEIKDRQKHVQSECEKCTKAVQKTRNSTQSHIELLGQHTAAFESASGVSAGGHKGGLHLHHTHTGGRPRPENDPYILKKGLLQRLAKQVQEENAQTQDLLGVQNHFHQFEAMIVMKLQEVLKLFNKTMAMQADTQKQLYADIHDKGVAIPPEFEWNNFMIRNANTLIDENAPKRTVESIRFPNEDHKSAIPLMEGPLFRKGKIMRSYYSAFFVVTPIKYLHEFKDLDNLNTNCDPEISLYLPECTISTLSNEGKFQISGKDAGSSLKGLSTKHEFAFKAPSYAEAAKWYESISQCVGTKSGESPAATPVGEIPQTSEKIPVDTQKPPPYSIQNGQDTSGVTRSTVGNTMGVPPTSEKGT